GVLDGDRGIELPDIRLRNDDVLSKSSVGVHADDLHVLADVRIAGAALHALAAGDMHFGGDKVAFAHRCHFIAHRGDVAAEFVPGDERRADASLRPAVPVVDMQVGTADGGDLYL